MILYSDQQRALLDQVAAALPPSVRSQFMQLVARQLTEAPTDTVEAAVRYGLDRVSAPTDRHLLTRRRLDRPLLGRTPGWGK
jgi:hypothetical protein